MTYRIEWEIEIDADTPREAAQAALAIQRRHDSYATAFKVFDESGEMEQVDLEEDEDEEPECTCAERSWYGPEHDSECECEGARVF